MQWIILYEPNGKYVCSSNLFVESADYARKFNSRKAAGAYMTAKNLSREDCRLFMWDPNTAYSESYIAELMKDDDDDDYYVLKMMEVKK